MSKTPSWWWVSTLAVLTIANVYAGLPEYGRSLPRLVMAVIYLGVVFWVLPRVHAEAGGQFALILGTIFGLGVLIAHFPDRGCLFGLAALAMAGFAASQLAERERS